jgi:chromosomal replication initiator protein
MTLEEAWRVHFHALEASVNKQSFDTWIRPLTFVGRQGREAVFGVPNKFFIDWMNEHYTESIQQNLRRLTADEGLEVTFAVQEGIQLLPLPNHRERRSKERQLQAKYVFETFVVGASNQFAHAASRRVAEQPGEIYNPFFIYGGRSREDSPAKRYRKRDPTADARRPDCVRLVGDVHQRGDQLDPL